MMSTRTKTLKVIFREIPAKLIPAEFDHFLFPNFLSKYDIDNRRKNCYSMRHSFLIFTEIAKLNTHTQHTYVGQEGVTFV